MATEPQDEFLRLEEETNRLLEVLSKLKQEIESYKTAHQALAHTAERVGELSGRCGMAAEQLGRLAETLRSVGPGQFLERLDALAKEVAAVRTELKDTLQRLLADQHALLRDQQAKVDTLRQQVRHLRAVSLWTLAIVVGSLVATLASILMR